MIDYIEVSTINLQDARERCRAGDQADELIPGCATWGIKYQGGQRGQMSRWPSGRGAVCFGADSLWGDWQSDGTLALDDSQERYDESGDLVNNESE